MAYIPETSEAIQSNVILQVTFVLTQKVGLNTVKSAYSETASKELLAIRKLLSFPNLYYGTHSLYVYKELWL